MSFRDQLIKALATRYGVSIPTIKRWLSGANEPHKFVQPRILKDLERKAQNDDSQTKRQD